MNTTMGLEPRMKMSDEQLVFSASMVPQFSPQSGIYKCNSSMQLNQKSLPFPYKISDGNKDTRDNIVIPVITQTGNHTDFKVGKPRKFFSASQVQPFGQNEFFDI